MPWSRDRRCTAARSSSFDDAAALKVPGRGARRADRADAGGAAVQSARRRRGDRAQHLGGDAGAQRAEDRLGRRPECELRLRCLQGDARGGRAQARARSCATTATSPRRSAAAAKRITAEYYLPHLAHASMEPPAASARITQGKCEVWGCFQSPQAARDLVAKRLGMPVENVTVHVTLARRRIRAQVQARLSASRRPCCPRRWTASRSRSSGRATTTCTTTISTRYRSSISKPASTRKGRRSRGCIAPSRRRSCRRSTPSARQEANWELGMGVINVPFAIPEHPHRESGSGRAHAHRLVPLGVEYSACVRGAVVRRRACRGGGARPEGLPARGDRPRARGVAADAGRYVEPRRIARALSRSTPAACGASRSWPRKRRAGADRCPRAAGSASPRTTVSSATSRRSWRSRSMRRAS